MDIVYIPDYAEHAKGLLLSQHRRSPRIVALVESLMGEAQLVEDIAFDLIVSTAIEVATDYELDLWGVIVGEPRGGLTDSEYRPFVQARIQANICNGDIDSVIGVFQTLMQDGAVRYFPQYPAGYTLEGDVLGASLSTEVQGRIRTVMKDVSPAGVTVRLVETDPGSFRFDSGPGFGVGGFARAY